MIKKFLKIAGIVLLVGIFFLFGARLLSGEDDWICVDGQWVKHGAPSAPMPQSGCYEEKTKLKVYFNNDKLDPEMTCVKVFPVMREVPKTVGVAKAALEELLKGPTEEEKNNGYLTNIINADAKIQKLTIENGIAKVDFDETLERAVGGSCRVGAIRSQITETLKQFPTVKEVRISINGRTEDILQP